MESNIITFPLISATVKVNEETQHFDGEDIIVESSIAAITNIPIRASVVVHIMNIMVGASVSDMEAEERDEFIEIIRKGFSETVVQQASHVTVNSRLLGEETETIDQEDQGS